jgi:hypothetical protein
MCVAARSLLLSLGLVALAVLILTAGTARAQVAPGQVVAVGEIRTARDAKIVRAGNEIVAAAGAAIAEKDILVTGASGSVGFILNDNSVITLGPSSLFRLNEFVFQPRENRLGLFGEIYAGTMEYISGKISKIAKDAAKFRTPYTTVAARGTRMFIRADE